MERIRISDTLPARPERIYRAWLDGAEHAAMTGAPATIEARPGGEHTAADGYIRGRIVSLVPDRRIVMTWRTSEFTDDDGDSKLEVVLDEDPDGTRITLIHSDIPDGQGAKYEQGWVDNYLEPMRAWLSKQ